MFERFTDRARKTMALANQEAMRFNHEYIGPEHIVLGLIKEGTGVGAGVLKNAGLNLRILRQEVEKRITASPEMVSLGKLPQTPAAKRVIASAIEFAVEMRHNYVGTEHLMMGIMMVKESNVAYDILTGLGLTQERIRSEIISILGNGLKRDSEHENAHVDQWDTSTDNKDAVKFSTFYVQHVKNAAKKAGKKEETGLQELFKRGYYLRPGGECKVEINPTNMASITFYELMYISKKQPIQVYVGSLQFAIRESLKISEG